MKVFISYAREDIETAKKLYHDLKRAGISPWMDKQDLLPGQNWRVMISKAIQESKYFLAVLSSYSLTKRGFVQKELKMALDILDEFPAEDIFLIPIRIEDCNPEDEKLKYLHWADFFPSYEDGLSQILRVLAPDYRAETVLQAPNISDKPAPQVQKPKYQLRKEPMTVSDEEAKSKFRLDKDWRPLEYIQNDFKDNGDGTIMDYATGLMWQKSDLPSYLYLKCLSGDPEGIERLNLPDGYLKNMPAYIERLNREKFAGYSDWRRPTVDELKSLLTPKKMNGYLYIAPIFDKKQLYCWTSDTRASGGAWSVRFDEGVVSWFRGSSSYVRAVRSI